MNIIEKYGAKWDASLEPIEIELSAISLGGSWINNKGEKCGAGLKQHFLNARKILWPNRYFHKWVDLIYEEIINNLCTILMGSFSCGKTSIASEFVLIDYFAHPDNTLVILSTTSVDKLKSAVFGEVSMLWQDARKKFPWLPGNLLDHKNAITTDQLNTDENEGEISIRDMRKGIFGKACYEGSRYVGLGVLAGIKQDRIRFLADELQFCAPTFFDCLPNMIGSVMLDKNNEPQIKIIGSGNPKHDPFDQLGIAAEPENGWESVGMIEKTTVWNTKFHRGRCVNLIGTDSPNFDVPETVPVPFPKLINRQTVKVVEKRWGKDSLKFNEQCVGRMMIGFAGNRVITRDLCRNNKAQEKVIWKGTPTTRIGFLDPSWTSSGDRCVWGWLEFGESIDGTQVIRYGGYRIVPIVGGLRDEPDDQIAEFVRKEAISLNISPADIFYGSTGRGTTGAALAKVFGFTVPVPIAEGGPPSARPVRHDLYVDDPPRGKRHKRCDEEYSKFITELWFAVRNVIECQQIRELPEEVINEGCARQYTTVKGYKIEVESKDEMKETLGYSPDLFDALAFGVEGARQRGFKIMQLGKDVVSEDTKSSTAMQDLRSRHKQLVRSKQLDYAA